VKAVKPTDIERFKAAKCESPGACNRALALLSRIFTLAALWGYREGCAPEHPVKRVTRYPERPSEFHFSTLEWGRLLIAADEDAIGEQADAQVGYQHKEKNRGGGLAVRMLAYTGARRSEVMTAHWDQVEFLPGVDGRSGGGGAFWTVESTNTKSGRPITRYLPRDLAERLATWRPAAMEAQRRDAVIAVGAANRRWWLFPQGPDPSKPLIGLHNVWERIKKAAGVQQGRIHDLRHTAATMLRQQGVPVSAIQVQLGHVSREITLRYAHSTHEELRRTGEALARLAEAAEDEARATAFQVPEPVDLAQERTRRQSRAAL
jgi:integrase